MRAFKKFSNWLAYENEKKINLNSDGKKIKDRDIIAYLVKNFVAKRLSDYNILKSQKVSQVPFIFLLVFVLEYIL